MVTIFFTEPIPNPEPVGCFWDYFDRALPDHYANFWDQIIWTNMNLTVNQCAPVAQDKGYGYFAVQSVYGECLITVEERRNHVQQIQEK